MPTFRAQCSHANVRGRLAHRGRPGQRAMKHRCLDCGARVQVADQPSGARLFSMATVIAFVCACGAAAIVAGFAALGAH
jgi:hypothetical protein